MTVAMAKSEKHHLAYSDYKHLSVDNLSFVAGLRDGEGRRCSTSGQGKQPQRGSGKPLSSLSGNGSPDEYEEKSQDGESSLAGGSSTARQGACPNRSCAARTETLEALMEHRVIAQTTRHKTQSKLGWARERWHETEKRFEEAQTELSRMSRAVLEADERTEILRSRVREEASINKELTAQLDALRADAMGLRRMVAENSLRHPVVFDVEPPPFDDGRVLRPPVSPAPGLSKTPKEARGRTWVHSGKLGNTRVFLTRRPSKATKRRGGQHPAATTGTRPSGASSSTLPVVEGGRDAAAGLGFAGDYGCAHPGAGGTGGSPEDRGGAAAAADGADLTDGEETWSCCGRTVEAAGRGCGPIEPSPKPKDLLLDVMDPRSRLGRPLDFRDFLPGFAWAGLTMDPVSFSKSSDDGAFRPRTAPERLEQNQPNGSSSSRSGGGGGGRRRPRPSCNRATPQKNARRRDAEEGAGPSRDAYVKLNKFSRHGGHSAPGGGKGLLSKSWSVGPRSGTYGGRTGSVRPTGTKGPRTHGARTGVADQRGRVTRCKARAAAGGASALPGSDDYRPRTQILGMNAGRPPREVRRAPLDRPLTAPCGKVGRWRVDHARP